MPRRGALGGLTFGLALVLADALVVDDRAATIADPDDPPAARHDAAGALLGALGGRAARPRDAARGCGDRGRDAGARHRRTAFAVVR